MFAFEKMQNIRGRLSTNDHVQRVLQWGTLASRIYFSPQVGYVYAFFFVTNVAVLLANTRYLPLGRGLTGFLETLLTLLFLFEVILRMVVVGDFNEYFRHRGNILDTTVCAVCIWLCLLHHAPEWEQQIDEILAQSLMLIRTLVQVIRAVALFKRQKSRENQDSIDFKMLEASSPVDGIGSSMDELYDYL